MASKANNRPASNGSKEATCVRCKTTIPPYAGREVALSKYAHHPGQCADVAGHEATVRAAAAEQGTLFAWRCERTMGHAGMAAPEICCASGTDRAAFTAHMRDHHGERPLTGMTPIRLRKGVPAAPRQTPIIPPFKRLAWAEKHAGPWSPEGQETWTTEHRGQFWANGPGAHSVIAIEDMRGTGRPNRLVTLYVRPDGSVTPDWSDAKHSRREANAAARRAMERSARVA